MEENVLEMEEIEDMVTGEVEHFKVQSEPVEAPRE